MSANDDRPSLSSSADEIQATALRKSAYLLRQALDGWGDVAHSAHFEYALGYNLRLWMLFRSELERDPHFVPALRDHLLRLAQEVEMLSLRLRHDANRDFVERLVEIDRQAAEGIRIPTA